MSLRRENRRLFTRLAIVAVAMFGFGFALVPFYNQICAALGINSLEQAETVVNTQVDRSRTVVIELDANAHNLPWRFKPVVSHVSVHPGELTTVEYEIVNVREAAVTGQAVPSYGPQHAAEYFKKIECFCFTQQTLAAGETRRMPVTFVVDPKLPASIGSIALSYTFFEVAGRGGKS
ncbi:MAG: cytochrome c oxidase assembly protein [Betaproteobacteria bacterium RIFCSPLOWO2_12_FULL_65_14]|nr:MAG: cytochrome c oxidase assembly protein [Betaproteobacteria bacterium RIFCSPLOWO2_12_FULL_65_14]